MPGGIIGRMLFAKAGATNKTMKVRAAGYVDEARS